MNDDSRAALIAQALGGDHGAFIRLVEPYRHRVYRLAWRFAGQREDAQDLTQEALLRAFRYLRSCRRDGKFGAWLMKIAVNVCIKHTARRQAEAQRSEALGSMAEARGAQAATSTDGNPHGHLDRQATAHHVREQLRRLPRQQQTAVVLFEMEGLSLQEVAAVMGRSVGTVKKHLHRARRTLSARLADLIDERETRSGRTGEGHTP